MGNNEQQMSFWEHLDVLRTVLLKILLVTVVCGMAAFFFKGQLFDIVLAPKDSGFITYRWMTSPAELLGEA